MSQVAQVANVKTQSASGLIKFSVGLAAMVVMVVISAMTVLDTNTAAEAGTVPVSVSASK